MLGVNPYGLDEAGSILGTAAWFAITLLLAGFAFWKGRLLLGMLAIFVPFLTGVWAAVRLATPTSPWARSRYDEAKMARARERFGPQSRGARFNRRFLNAIGGKPSEPDVPPPLAEREPSASD